MKQDACLCFFFSFISLFDCSVCENERFPEILIGDIMIKGNHDLWDRRHGPLVDMRESRWPGGIVPYDYNETTYTVLDLYVIRGALSVIEKSSCIRFVRRTTELDYIYITQLGGCWSFVGRQGSEQTLSLVAPHCLNRGTVIHEFMHALGFWHEHSRSDRDDYIDVIWHNVVDAEKQANFAKLQPEALNFFDYPYDYQSVMHYDAFVFSKSPKLLPTMKPKKPNVKLRDLGLAKAIGTLTESDKKKLNSLYECEN